MANVKADYRYTKDHEWLHVEGDTATIGISDYAQESLGDVVYVDLPSVGASFAAHESFGSVESVKAVSDLFLPVSGEVIEVNENLANEGEKVNSDPYGEAWMIKIKLANPEETNELMTAEQYEEYLSKNE